MLVLKYTPYFFVLLSALLFVGCQSTDSSSSDVQANAPASVVSKPESKQSASGNEWIVAEFATDQTPQPSLSVETKAPVSEVTKPIENTMVLDRRAQNRYDQYVDPTNPSEEQVMQIREVVQKWSMERAMIVEDTTLTDQERTRALTRVNQSCHQKIVREIFSTEQLEAYRLSRDNRVRRN